MRTTALARIARHHTDLDVGLLCQTPYGAGNNLPCRRLELESGRSSQVRVLALLLAAEQTRQNKGKKSHQCTIRHAAILPCALPFSKPNF